MNLSTYILIFSISLSPPVALPSIYCKRGLAINSGNFLIENKQMKFLVKFFYRPSQKSLLYINPFSTTVRASLSSSSPPWSVSLLKFDFILENKKKCQGLYRSYKVDAASLNYLLFAKNCGTMNEKWYGAW